MLLNSAAGDLDVSDELTIAGAGADVSVINGSGIADRILSADEGAASLTIVGVRLTGAIRGAIDAERARLTIDGSRIDGNEGDDEIVEHDPEESPATLIIRDTEIDRNTVRDQDDGDELDSIVQFDPRSSADATMIVERSSLSFRDATDKQDADPKLAALAANGGPTQTMALDLHPGDPLGAAAEGVMLSG